MDAQKMYAYGVKIAELALVIAATVAIIMKVFSFGPDLSWFGVLLLLAFAYGAERVRKSMATAVTKGLKK